MALPDFKEGEAKKIAFQFQCVTWKLEKALGSLPYHQFDISEEVQEQVSLGKYAVLQLYPNLPFFPEVSFF